MLVIIGRLKQYEIKLLELKMFYVELTEFEILGKFNIIQFNLKEIVTKRY